MRAAIYACALIWSTSAFATGSGCSAFKWDVTRARDLLGQPSAPAVSAGTEIEIGGGTLVVLGLTPLASTTPPVRPDKAPGQPPMVGWVSLHGAKPGRLEVALPQEGWIDLIEDGKPLKAVDFTGAMDCPGIRKVVAFSAAGHDYVLQITASAVDQIGVALIPSP